MARRDRVPRHKSRTHKRNENAKLSPFQREQKRSKMANQVPTAATMGSLDSVPHSQRRIFDYLKERRSRQQARRAALEQTRGGRDVAVAVDDTPNAACVSSSNDTHASAPQMSAAAEVATGVTKRKKASKAQAAFASLNDELGASVGAVLQPLASRRSRATDGDDAATTTSAAGGGDASAPRTVEEIIARKKERKHRRKQEARRVRVAAQLQEAQEQLDEYAKTANSAGKRGRKRASKAAAGEEEEEGAPAQTRDRVNVAFERKLRTMEKEKEEAQQQQQQQQQQQLRETSRKRRRGASQDAGEHALGDGSEAVAEVESTPSAPPPPQQQQRKRISFDAEVEDRAAAADESRGRSRSRNAPRKPQDFYELVDVVRYGERVEAPPVFDVLPNRNAAVSRLARELEREESRSRDDGAARERHRLLAGGGQLAQQKRLARLGLAPAITHTTSGAEPGAAARMSKAEEIKALRDRVMATYQRNRRREVVERKGVNMKHEFPQFA
ncbi:hypothetical protein NESM_000444300 [Novymonas esmeraldas]|uniref:Uncharacterized protein n=1 Tax=Novymonas esmeraldas TaxID=1808958 RepID=A0AAW0EPW9_9TRYP